MSHPRLHELALRIERLVVAPDRGETGMKRLLRPWLRLTGWQLRLSTEMLGRLLARLRAPTVAPADSSFEHLLDAAVAELAANITNVERATILDGEVPVAHAAWLRRVFEVTERAAAVARAEADPLERRRLEESDDLELRPPQTVATNAVLAQEPAGARLVALDLAAIDHLERAARQDAPTLERQRRLLEAARLKLLECSAAMALDQDGVARRLGSIGDGLARVERLRAAGVDPRIGLIHQLETALSRGERRKLYATLVALDRGALEAGDKEILARTSQALERLAGASDIRGDDARAASFVRSAAEILGASASKAIARGCAEALSRGRTFTDLGVFSDVVAPGPERATLAAVLAADGRFEVGGGLSPARITDEVRTARIVPHPTQDLVLVPAREPRDVLAAVIEDPRSVMLSLAAGRLLARRFVKDEVVKTSRPVMQSEVRVYVLDGSGSMLGSRATMRDAILIAELATLHRRLTQQGGWRRVVLYFAYFNEALGEMVRVDDPEAALALIPQILAAERRGGTDIERALLGCFDVIRQAGAQDPDLSEAQIVLVTDGEADVDAGRVEASRAAAGQVPIGLSVMALGQENPTLRRLVAGQRARGERAFYHFTDDETIAGILQGGNERGPVVHLPAGAPPASSKPSEEVAELEALLGDLVGEIVSVERTRFETTRRARRSREPNVGEGALAEHEALDRDDAALRRRFERWFPSVEHVSAPMLPEEGTLEREDLETVLALLANVTEIVDLLDGSPRDRQVDAITLLEALLPEARLGPGRYDAVVRLFPGALARALAEVHAACRLGFVRALR